MTGTETLFGFRRLRDVWHVLMGEVWGALSGYALLKVARHAFKAHDVVTVYRVREVIQRGVEVGWTDNSDDDGKIVPNRDDQVAQKVSDLIAGGFRG